MCRLKRPLSLLLPKPKLFGGATSILHELASEDPQAKSQRVSAGSLYYVDLTSRILATQQ